MVLQSVRAFFLPFPRDILTIYARTVAIDRRGLLLVGEKKHEAAYRLSQRLQGRAAVLMGSVQALSLGQQAAALPPSAPAIPASPLADSRLAETAAPVAASSAGGQSPAKDQELSIELIRALVLPAGLPLRLKALTLAGEIAARFKN